MSDRAVVTRREIASSMSGLVAGAMLAASIPTGAYAAQGNMEAALGELNGALASLRAAAPNKGGHRERAIQLVEQAIAEVQAGIEFAAD